MAHILGHITLIKPPSDVFRHFRIGRAMINVLVKFEISTSAGCEDMKGDAKVDNG